MVIKIYYSINEIKLSFPLCWFKCTLSPVLVARPSSSLLGKFSRSMDIKLQLLKAKFAKIKQAELFSILGRLPLPNRPTLGFADADEHCFDSWAIPRNLFDEFPNRYTHTAWVPIVAYTCIHVKPYSSAPGMKNDADVVVLYVRYGLLVQR